jgi:peptide/nickel transport system ATP-binding protein
MAQPLLQVKDLVTGFYSDGQYTAAVNSVSFDLYPGETIGIVGESGSGKSVTSLSLMRLIASPPGKIQSGQIIFQKQGETPVDLLQLSEKQMRSYRGNEIAMIFQEPMTSLNPVIKCGKQITEALELHLKLNKKQAYQRTIELFNEVQLPRPEQIFNSYPHQLSGGQKQRVMIAMAMSCNPSVLIADEPTTALDVTVQKAILALMKQLQQKHGMSIIFITHDLGVIAEIADKVLVMYKGNIVEEESVKEIFREPKHPYTKGLLACRPPLDRRLSYLPVVSDFMETNDDGILIEKKGTEELLSAKNIINKQQRDDQHRRLYAEEPLLEIRGLKKWYPVRKGLFRKAIQNVKAVDDVSFLVYPGETLGLVGESGCGKTTLGRTILRLIEPTGGSVIYNGKNLLTLASKEMRQLRKEIQIIFQDPYSSLNPRITVGMAILEPMRVHRMYKNDKERKQKVLELLEKVGLAQNHLFRYPHEFSGGQRQRVCIARALALNPRFIICDESVSALDVSVQAQVLNLLNSLKKEFGFTYIFISHDLSVVKFMSDRMIVMKDGKIVEEGDADMVYDNPREIYTQNLIDAIPKGL